MRPATVTEPAPITWLTIRAGQECDGGKVGHVVGRNEDFVIYTTSDSGIRWMTRDDFEFAPDQREVFQIFDEAYSSLRMVPHKSRAGLVESLASALYRGLLADDKEGRAGAFRSVTTLLRPFVQAAEARLGRIAALQDEITALYASLPGKLERHESMLATALEQLREAEEALAEAHTDPMRVVDASILLAKIKATVARARGSSASFFAVLLIVYVIVILVAAGYTSGLFELKNVRELAILEVPVPIWIWALIGSLTSMLFRAGQFAFIDMREALRWLLFRPLVGLIMGVILYLMVIAGLVVFAGTTEPKTEQLLWVIAFAGAFSDTVSIGLLEKTLGRFRNVEQPTGEVEPKPKPAKGESLEAFSDARKA
jgi:hypothetical protein